ncbi:hypothetical protein Q5P01_000723 [Channa striata]|uniref:Uncharacterized protein n=1 Tax=Channa striata TaxID=64152 RepID=A0AA88LMY2_CHASR|nr:hypothetical protein Q5P01_000723 [Channa striata]
MARNPTIREVITAMAAPSFPLKRAALRMEPGVADSLLPKSSLPVEIRESKPPAMPALPRCMSVPPGTPTKAVVSAEVDLVAHDMVTNTVALLELKTRNNDVLDNATLWRYNTQLWLTWTMFSLTYPSAAERSSAYLVIIRPGTSTVTIRSCMRPTVSKTLRDKFPWLNCLCPQVLNCLTPACVNMRVGTRLNSGSADGRRRKRSGVDPSDLCFRNMMFNQEKARVSLPLPEEERRKLRRALPPTGGIGREARTTGVGK